MTQNPPLNIVPGDPNTAPGQPSSKLRPEEAEQRAGERKEEQQAEQKVDATHDRLTLSASLTGARIDNLRETLDSMGTVYKEFYDLGQAKTENANVTTMRGLEPSVLVGSVDSTRFGVEWHEEKWYKPYIESSNQISKLFEHKLFDNPTQTWLTELKPALDLFVQLGTYNPKDYTRKHKNEIWKLVKAKGTSILYGEKGLFNFVLAFDRLKNICPKLNDVAKGDFKWEEFSVEAIKLVLGAGKGKIKGKDDRYAYMVVKKAEEKKTEPVVPGGPQGAIPSPAEKGKVVVEPGKTAVGPAGAVPNPTGKVAVEPKPVPPEVAPVLSTGKIPDFKTPEFYKYYEIDDQKEFEDALKPIDEWLTQDMQKFLKNPRFWEDMGVVGSPERNSKIKMYFDDGDKTGAITGVLFPSLYNLANDYPKFYGDLKNSQSLKYQELFAITMQRALEYYKNINFNRFSIKSVVFLTMFEQAENEDFSKDYRKSILTKLISYCEGMSKEDIGGRADWEESLKEYREQMTKLEKV